MLMIQDLGFSMAGKPLFEKASLRVPDGARLGMVGRNGTGKTTLFRLIRGELTPDAGEIILPERARIGGVAQEAPAEDRALIETVLDADTERARLMAEAETATDPGRIAEIHTRLTDIQAHSAEARAASILSGLGFDHEAQQRPSHEFSGGWRMRIALAGVLFSAPDLLLLDEPTNYLDLEGAVWLERYLARYPHTLLIISHDRGLLNRAVNGIVHLHNRDLTLYTGGYDNFDRIRREKLALQAAAAKKQEANRAHLQSFVDRFRYKASKAKQAQSRLKMIERMEPIAAEIEGAVAPIRFPDPGELAPPLMMIEDVQAGYDGRTVLHNVNLRIDDDDRIALLGQNGQGKSTLAKIVSGHLAPMAGQRKASGKLKIGYFAQHQTDELVREETPLDHYRRALPGQSEASLRSRLAAAGIGVDIVSTKVANLSGGQKARLLLALSAIGAPHLLILDEPTNHLDIESRAALVSGLNAYSGAVILITHDAHLIELTADRLWLVKDGKVASYQGDMSSYRDTLLGPQGSAERVEKAKAKERAKEKRPAPQKPLNVLRAEVRNCEARLTKIADMLERIDAKLADPELYEGPARDATALQIKRMEIVEAQARAEEMWLAAEEALEAAQSQTLRAGE
ncbi:ABC-F family ATP-binding cassette domain-containing protein [Rhodobacteraceae bacterium NNCM2]|nr:ABC-F family ATP-binding cassette domain-containing protein [Coraliihabitans acroporae]